MKKLGWWLPGYWVSIAWACTQVARWGYGTRKSGISPGGVKTKPIASGLNVGNIQFSPCILCFSQSVGKFYFCSRKEIVSCPPQISCKIPILLFTGLPCLPFWTGLVFSMYMGFPELEKKHCRVLMRTMQLATVSSPCVSMTRKSFYDLH